MNIKFREEKRFVKVKRITEIVYTTYAVAFLYGLSIYNKTHYSKQNNIISIRSLTLKNCFYSLIFMFILSSLKTNIMNKHGKKQALRSEMFHRVQQITCSTDMTDDAF